MMIQADDAFTMLKSIAIHAGVILPVYADRIEIRYRGKQHWLATTDGHKLHYYRDAVVREESLVGQLTALAHGDVFQLCIRTPVVPRRYVPGRALQLPWWFTLRNEGP